MRLDRSAIFQLISLISTALIVGCTNVVPEVGLLSKTPNRAKIENDYLAISSLDIPPGRDMTITDDKGNSFDLTLSHMRGGFRYFAAKTPGLIIKTGIVYSVLMSEAKASAPVPIYFEGGSGSGLPTGGSDGQILKVVSGVATWTNINQGLLAAKDTVSDADITSVDYSKISNLPVTFPPSSHSHAQSDVAGLTTALGTKMNYASNGARFSLINDATVIGARAMDLQNVKDNNTMIASGVEALAIGSRNIASGELSVSMGGTNTAAGSYSISIGNTNTASSQASTAIGTSNNVQSFMGRAVGHNNTLTATAEYSSAFGVYNTVSGANSTTMGYSLQNDFDNSSMIGNTTSYKVFIPGPITFKAITNHINKLLYCDLLVMYADGSFSKGYLVIQTDSSANVTLRQVFPRVTFFDATSAPTLNVTMPTATSVSVSGTPTPSRFTFECQNMN